MLMKNRKFIYLSDLNFDGTIYQTQVIDWLELYKTNKVVFDLYHVFHIRQIFNLRFILNQIKGIKNHTQLYKGFLIFFPSKSVFVFLNVLFLYLQLLKYFTKNNEILIFARGLLGKEIDLLRRLSPLKIIYFFDARGAGGEENKYLAIKQKDFSCKKFKTIAHVYYQEYRTLLAADKTFVVSNALQKYFQDAYCLNNKKFVLYPCLSTSDKFYYNPVVRDEFRLSLRINDQTRVYIYSGGFNCEWHISERMFTFINQLFQFEKNSLLICLTKNPSVINKTLDRFPKLKSRFMAFSAQNHEVYKYFNAADYGILFRENVIMNNVASPTKFSEYILCGLPVIISEGIGDYSDFTLSYKIGVLLKESELEYPQKFDFRNFIGMKFDRKYISDIGRMYLSKDSAINNIISELIS
jgi:hypothetical protein